MGDEVISAAAYVGRFPLKLCRRPAIQSFSGDHPDLLGPDNANDEILQRRSEPVFCAHTYGTYGYPMIPRYA